MNKKNYIFLAWAAALVLSACARETVQISEPARDGANGYLLTASAQIATKASFKDEEAPNRYIYWDDNDVFDVYDMLISGEDELMDIASTQIKPTLSDGGKTASFRVYAHDYVLLTYPSGAVTVLDSAKVTTWISSKESIVDTVANYQAVKVSVAKEQKLASTLQPGLLPMVTSRFALSDAAKALVAEGKDTVSVTDGNAVVHPLAALVKMTVTGLPEVSEATITGIDILSEFSASSTSTGTVQRGMRGDNVFLLGAEPALLGNWESGDSRFDLVLSDGSVAYTADKGAEICFVANHSNFGVKTLQVVVRTADGAVYKKKFDMSKAEKQIAFNRARISSFTLDFTNGTVSKASDTKFAVEWSKGYLVYDAEGKAYKIGEPEDVPVYFKFGSPVGIQFYKDRDDWASRLKPRDPETGEFMTGSSNFMDNKITLSNGTDMFYSGMLYSGTRFYGDNAIWQDTPYYTVAENGEVVAGTIAGGNDGDEFNYHKIFGSHSFEGKNDPCSYVKGGSWRLPTENEINDLIAVGAPGLTFFTEDGSDVKGSSGNGSPVYAKYADGEQDLVFKMYGNVTQSFSSAYTVIQMTFGNKYAARFWSSTYVGTEAPAKGTGNGGRAFNLSVSSAPGFNTAAAVASYPANRLNNYTTKNGVQYTLWDALPVRCVRAKN